MATSKRRAALDDLVTALGTITVANGYANTITTVALRAFEWETVYQDYALPVIGVVPLDVTYDYRSSDNIIIATQRVAIEFGYSAPTQQATWDTGDALVDDIIGAMHVDTTRGGNALHTQIVSAQTDSGNPDVMDSRGGTAMGIIQATITLNRGWVVTP